MDATWRELMHAYGRGGFIFPFARFKTFAFQANSFSMFRILNIEYRIRNFEQQKFFKGIRQYSSFRYSAVPCSAVLRFKINDFQSLAQTWVVRPEFNTQHFQNIIAIATYSMHVALSHRGVGPYGPVGEKWSRRPCSIFDIQIPPEYYLTA